MTSARFDTLAIKPGGLRAALEICARGERPVLIRWHGAVLSPQVASFAEAVLSLADDPAVFGATVALPRYRPQRSVPFVPVEDGADTLYLRCMPDAAAVFTPLQAGRALAGWRNEGDGSLVSALTQGRGWLIAPRMALGYGASPDSSRHLATQPRGWRITPSSNALALYDNALEIEAAAAQRIAPMLTAYDFAVDLWGDRAGVEGLLLSSRPCRAPVLSFALEITPPEANLVRPTDGGFFSLGHAEDFGPMTAMRRETLFRHATRFNALGDYAAQFAAPLRRLLGARR